MKSLHYYPKPAHAKPSKLELAVFGFVLILFAIFIGLLTLLGGCASPGLPGQTPSERKLATAQSAQLSHAAAAVNAAQAANQANPDGLPKTATAGELSVADANLPPAKTEDAREALARVNAALTGELATAQKAWNDAETKGHYLEDKVDTLQKQVATERAAATANEKKANDRLCIIAALIVGGVLVVAAALSLAAGMYFSLTKLEYGAGGLGLCGALAFFAATQVGSVHFNFLATAALLGGIAGGVYVVWQSFAGGSAIQAKANGFDQVFSALRKFAGEVATDTETGAKSIWHWVGTELDRAQKALVADWQKLETVFADKPKSAPPTTPSPSA